MCGNLCGRPTTRHTQLHNTDRPEIRNWKKKRHLLENLFTTEKKQKQNKRFIIDQQKTSFITEPFYNREKKMINKRFVVDKKMPFIREHFYHGGKKTCINLTKSKVAIYSDYKSSPDAIIYWRFNLSNWWVVMASHKLLLNQLIFCHNEIK